MDDTVEKVGERLSRLEDTVAKGFYRTDARLAAMSNKIDISVEALRGDLKSVMEILTAHIEEMRRTTESIRKEHAADREVLKLSLQDHTIRLEDMENWRRSL